MRHAQSLNEAQFRKVLHYCRTRRHANRDTATFMVSFFAGLRAKEIAALKLGDIFDAEGRVREQFTLESNQTKGGQRRSVFINTHAVPPFIHHHRDLRLIHVSPCHSFIKDPIECRVMSIQCRGSGSRPIFSSRQRANFCSIS